MKSDMETLLVYFIYIILFGLSRPEYMSPDDLKAFTFPSALMGATAKMVVETSPCSATCGIGKKTEKRCTVDEKVHDCEYVTVECVISYLCDMHTYTLPDGDNITMKCLEDDFVAENEGKLLFHWKVARGVLTKEDDFFTPLLQEGINNKHPAITLKNVQEETSGTYRCDIQTDLDMKLVKRVYHGVKVVPPKLVNLNYDKFLRRQKEKEEAAAKKTILHVNVVTKSVSVKTWLYIMFGVGSGGGIMVGILILYLYRHRCRKRQPDIEEGEDW